MIRIGDDIEVKILEVKGDSIRIGIEAPKTIDILRGELVLSISETNTESAKVDQELLTRFTKKIKKTSKKN